MVLELTGLKKVYGAGSTETVALQDISLSIGRGEFVLIVGSSGSGKSTLLNMVGLLDAPTSGQILVDGENPGKLDDSGVSAFRNKKIGFIFQFANLLQDLTVLENVMLPRQIANRDGARARATELLKLVGISEHAGKRANLISGGQAQRAAIARGLVNDPAIVLADEPTGNLDSVTAKVTVDLMKSMAKKLRRTFIVVTHDRHQFGDVDRVITIKDGRATDGDPRASAMGEAA